MSINTFSSLKASGQKTLDKLTAEIAKIQDKGGQSKEDNRYWKPTVDKAGNGSAVIRFLPAPPGEDLPFIRYWDHGFQGPSGKWYIEKSLTTLGKEDPVSEYNSELWAVSTDDNSPTRKQARAQKRRLHFVANIYVVKDPGNPDNEGQVFLYEFGKKIFDKIMDKARPTFEDEDPVNVFDLWEGADFKLRQRKVEGYPNYDQSTFGSPSAIAESEEDILEIVNRQYLLKDFVDPSKFKSYDELSKKLETVLNSKPVGSAREFESADDDDNTTQVTQSNTRKVDTKRTSIPTSNSKASLQSDSGDSDDDDGDTMAYFRNLVNDD